MHCHHFLSGQCHSCDQLDQPYPEQLRQKQQHLQTLFASMSVSNWQPFVGSVEQGFRNKAKMVVLGAAHAPILGIVNAAGQAVDLTDCPLYSPSMQAILLALPGFIQQAGIPPYQIHKQKGELKYVLLTQSRAHNRFMLRFVLRSDVAIERIKRQLPQLQHDFPAIDVVSVNLQPTHMAIMEGETEIFLTEQQHIIEILNGIPLAIRPKSFFQTHPELAAQLYATAAAWADNMGAKYIWDLFCGVGGFGLHCLKDGVNLMGIEIEAEAITCARQSAQALSRAHQVNFSAFDATSLQQQTTSPDLVIVNPPRRGIGASLCSLLNDSQVPDIIYSSCNAQTLVEDVARLSQYRLQTVQGFDFFPHTRHYEVLVHLHRK